MLQLMKLHAFFLASPSLSSSNPSFSSPSSVVVLEKGDEEGREGEEGKSRSDEMLMHISAEGFGKAKHLREILRYGTQRQVGLTPFSYRSLFDPSVSSHSFFFNPHKTGPPKQRRTKSCFSTTKWVICKVRSGACLSFHSMLTYLT